jgi:uncharacterized membrane protein (DUF4010 family)
MLALGLGLLVGLQRQYAHDGMAGIRTFPLVTILGVLSGAMASEFGGWVPAAAVLAVTALMIQSNRMWAQGDEDGIPDTGLTTEAAALVMLGVGVILWLDHTVEAIVVAGVVAFLLHLKRPLHRMVDALNDDDLRAIFQLVLVALIILPLLPDREFGPFGVLNPFEIWFMVALIVGISIAAWAAYRIWGHKRGTALTGVLGGLISSTATTVSQARRARNSPAQSGAAAFIVLMASAVAFARILFEIGIVARAHFLDLAPPLAILMGTLLVAALWSWRRSEKGASGGLAAEAPSELRSAIVFGLLYAVILLAVAAAREHLGDAGLYGVAFISGLTDMDAITLSTAHLVGEGRVSTATGWRVVVVASLANLVFKGGALAVIGSPAIRRPVLVGFGVTLLVGVGLVLFWG